MQEFLDRGDACPKTLTCTHYTELLEVPRFRSQPGLALWTMEVTTTPGNRPFTQLQVVVRHCSSTCAMTLPGAPAAQG